MCNMETETPATRSTPATREPGGQGKTGTRSRRTGMIWLLVLLAVLIALGWWLQRQLREQGSEQTRVLETRLDQLARSNEQLRRDLESLRSRDADAKAINQGIREELLAYNERSRALEDAVANLAEQHLGHRDAMALDEAEFILQLAGERLALFRDANGALAAYRLADSALAAAEDPLFANVRQTIAAEMRALEEAIENFAGCVLVISHDRWFIDRLATHMEEAKPVQVRASLDALVELGAGLHGLPLKKTIATPDAGKRPLSRWREILGRFVRINDDSTAPQLSTRNDELNRSLIAVDVHIAETMLLARDEPGFKAALARVRGGVANAFDPDDARVQATMATLDRLAAMPMAPALPQLGSALGELRNLRTTRALSRPIPAPIPNQGATP